MKLAKLLAGSFPPGSSIPYIEAVLGQGKQIDETEKKTNGNTQSIEELNETVVVLREDVDAAQQAADTAQQTADAAQESADTAKDAADAAQETADSAVTAAQSAQGSADAANEAIEVLGDRVIVTDNTAPQIVQGPLQAASFRVGGVKVVGSRVTGFTDPTGTGSKAGIAADATYAVGAAYSQSEVAALAAGLVEARKTIAALQALILSHGLGGA